MQLNFRRKKISTLKYQLLEYYPFSASILLAVDCEKGKKIDLQGYKTTSFLKAELEGEYRLGYRMMKQLQDTGYSFQKTWDTCSISDVVTNLIFPLEAREIFFGGGKGWRDKGGLHGLMRSSQTKMSLAFMYFLVYAGLIGL